MNKNNILMVAGFLLFITSILDFILNLVGLSLYGYELLDRQGFLIGLIFKFVCLTAGLTMVYYAKVVKK